MRTMVLIRHGQSQWNLENRFTGWTDVDLSDKGIQEAHLAGRMLKADNFAFDLAYTSVLKRAIKTLDIILDEMDLLWIDVHKTWKLNERHYGALQGLNKADTAAKYGDEQVKIWRRSYDIKPPILEDGDERLPSFDPRYKNVLQSLLPKSESLKDTIARVVPFWSEIIQPAFKEDKKIIIAAHGNSLRALIKYIDNVSDKDIVDMNIPTGTPLIYEFNDEMKPIRHYYLGGSS